MKLVTTDPGRMMYRVSVRIPDDSLISDSIGKIHLLKRWGRRMK